MEAIDAFLESFNSGDKEIRSWFLVRHNYTPFVLCGCYFIFATVIGPALMKNRKPFVLRKPMIVFNLFLVFTYTVSLFTILSNLPSLGAKAFCNGVPVRKGELAYKLTRCCWIIYLLKYIEFADTAFFILRKKNHLITNLHVIHHTLVPLLGWVMLRSERSGFQSIPVMLNAFVHIIMYSYYGLAAIGPQMKKYLWWKKYLTMIQMIQFVLMILFVTVLAPLSGCHMMKSSILMDFFGASAFFLLFYNFYKNSFASKGKAD